MPATLKTTRQFENNLRTVRERGKDLNKLWDMVHVILANEPVPARYRPHKLSGDWQGFWECHIEPNWLLIWLDAGHSIVLIRTGTHADLFT